MNEINRLIHDNDPDDPVDLSRLTNRKTVGQLAKRAEPFFTVERRRWLYGIATAVLAIIAVWLGWDAVTSEQWSVLIAAIFNFGGAVTTALARSNT